MRVRITEGIVTSTTLLLIAVLLTIMIAGCGMTPLQTATAGPPTYADQLSNPNAAKMQAARWDGPGDNDNQCFFKPNGYHVIQKAIPYDSLSLHACHENSNPYGNATIVVNVTILTGHSGGLFLRFSKDSLGIYTGYLFEIDNNRNYKFSIFTGVNILNPLDPLIVLKDWTFSSALKFGFNVTNQLAVIINGNTFALYANDTCIATVTDPSNTYNSGDVAFFASTANVTTEVAFSNLKVYLSS